MNDIELSAGAVEYIDTRGAGSVLVLLHGLMMDATGRGHRGPVRRLPVRGAYPAARRAPGSHARRRRPLAVRRREKLADFDRPVLVVWAAGDRVMPPEHGRRLAGLLPQGRLVDIPDSYTLVPLDQPAKLAAAIREFIPASAAAGRPVQ